MVEHTRFQIFYRLPKWKCPEESWLWVWICEVKPPCHISPWRCCCKTSQCYRCEQEPEHKSSGLFGEISRKSERITVFSQIITESSFIYWMNRYSLCSLAGFSTIYYGILRWLSRKNPSANEHKRCGLNHGPGRSLEEEMTATLGILAWKIWGQESLVGYSPQYITNSKGWEAKLLDIT